MDIDATAHAIIERSAYLTLATADADGVPWASPVWFAPEDDRRLLWISDPGARHSRNLAVRPEASAVIFDSHAPIGTGQGVYLEGRAARVDDGELDAAMQVFSARSLAQGGVAFTADDVRAPARLRLYRFVAAERWIGDRKDQRVPLRA